MQEAQENLSSLFFKLLRYLGTVFEFLRAYWNKTWVQHFLRFSYHKAPGGFFAQLATEWQRTCCRHVCSVVTFGPQITCVEKGPGSLCRGAWLLLPPQTANWLRVSHSSGWPAVGGTSGPGAGRGRGVTVRGEQSCLRVYAWICLSIKYFCNIWTSPGRKIPCGDFLLHQTLHHHNRQLRLRVSEIK